MKIKKSRGVIVTAIIGICFFLLGCVIFFANSNEKTPKEIYDGGSVYGKIPYSKNEVVAANIVDITKGTETDTGTLVYFARTKDSNQVVGLEVNKDSKTKKIIDDWQSSGTESVYIAAKMVKFDSESSGKLAQRNVNSPIKINAQYFLSASEYDNDAFWMPILSGGIIVFGLFIVGASVINWRKNKKRYNELLALYPELAQSSTLSEQAKFIGEKSKLVIYKNHLLALSFGINTIDLTQIKWLGISVVPVYRSTNAQIEAVDLEDKLITVDLGKYKNKFDTEYAALFEYLQEHYPNILLGEDNRPEQIKAKGVFGKGSKKTITEFLEEKQQSSKENNVVEIEQGTQQIDEQHNDVEENKDELVNNSDNADTQHIKENETTLETENTENRNVENEQK